VLIVGDSLSSDIRGGWAYGIDTCWYNPRRMPHDASVAATYEIHELTGVLPVVEQAASRAG
jgi:2-haloacid dehalogenase